MAATEDQENNSIKKKLSRKFAKILKIGWTRESIKKCTELADTREKRFQLLKVADIIIMCKLREYDFNEKHETVLDIFQHSPDKWEKDVYNIAMFQFFPGTYTKPLEELIDEIYELNDLSCSILQPGKLKREYDQVISAYNNPSVLSNFEHSEKIKFWKKNTIRAWAERVKTDESVGKPVKLQEKIAVVKRAVEITNRFGPRDVQLLSAIISLNTEKEKGRLTQINTGEGKTIIIAMFAAIKALEAHKVDIITSSPELAKPHAKEHKTFFSHFGLNVAYIKDKEAYKADVLYGDATSFQGDILKDEYLKLNIRQKRPFDIGIVDEVDSMCLDGKTNIVKLSSPMPAFDQLEPVLALIWNYMGYATDKIIEEDGNTYFLEQVYDENGQERTCREERVLLDCSKTEFLKMHLQTQLRMVLRDTPNIPESELSMLDNCPRIEIPSHLRDFVTKCQLQKWIANAIRAKYYFENKKDYIIKDKKIAPVDTMNTGVVQLNMLWADALHQYLQIKHGAKLSAESLTTNYISNVTFFKRYKDKLYGFTGTLGSFQSRMLLHDTYDVDSIIVPPFQKTQFVELMPLLTKLEENWYQNIVRTSLIHLTNGRPVLIITKYIKEADEISEKFKNDFDYYENKVKQYKTEEDSHVITEELQPGVVIIATNIAGRGTDLKLSNAAEENGGLHVCMTFLPVNQRVEKQNIGRTSRKGCKGTAQFVLLEKQTCSLPDLRRMRDAMEMQTLGTAGYVVQKVILQDEIFKKFCELLDEVKHLVPPDNSDIQKTISHSATEERFAIWLKGNNEMFDTESRETVLQNFESFKEEIKADAKAGCLVKNPYYYILEGHRLLDSKNYITAIDRYTKAIAIDKNVFSAYYYRAYASIAEYGNDPKKHHDKIQNARKDLDEAKQIITGILEPMLLLIRSTSKGEALTEQVNHKLILLNVLKYTIDSTIGPNYDELIKQLESEKEMNGKTHDEMQCLEEKIKDYRDKKEKNEGGIIDSAIKSDKVIKIELRDIKDFLNGEDITRYDDEIEEFKYNGLHGCIVTQEKSGIPWLSVAAYLAIAVTFCVVGVLGVLGGGVAAYFGYAAIFEGLTDIVTTVRDGIFGDGVNFKHWLMGKAVFTLVSLATFGYSAIANSVKAVCTACRQVVKTGITQSVKEAWKTAAKALGVSFAQKLGQESLNYISQVVTVNHILPSIEEKIFNSINDKIKDIFANNYTIQRAIIQDANNRNMRYQTLILNEVDSMLFSIPSKNHWLWDIWTVIKNSAIGIAQYHFNQSANLLTLASLTNMIREICAIAPTRFIESLDRKLHEPLNEQLNQEPLENPQVEQTADPTYYATTANDGDIDIGRGKELQEQVVLDRNANPEDFAEKVSRKLSAKITHLVYSEVILPFNYRATGYVVNTLTSSLNEMVSADIFNYQQIRKVANFKEKYMSGDVDPQFEDELQRYVAAARNVIEGMKDDESMDFYCLKPLSVAIDRPIVIMNEEGKIMHVTGETFSGASVCIEYRQGEQQGMGGWAIPGRSEVQNSLFHVVAEQLGTDYATIKGSAISVMENNVHYVAKRVKDAEVLDFFYENVLMINAGN